MYTHETIRGMASLGEAQEFYLRDKAELDKALFGEEQAKKAVSLAIAMGENVALVGLPGVGKSELTEAAGTTISGIDHSVYIPAQADLRPERLIGAHVDISKSVNGHEETIVTDLPPLIHSDTQKLAIDEASRINPHALGATLELIRKKEVATTAGKLSVKGLEFVIANLNPTESTQNTFNIADAFASRFPLAVVVGVRNRESQMRIARGEKIDKESIDDHASLEEVHAIRELINSSKIGVSDKVAEHIVDTTYKITDELSRNYNFHEGDGRMIMQMRKLSKGIAAFAARENVTEEDVAEAAQFVMVSRLGLAGLRGTQLTIDEVDSAVKAHLSA